MTQHHRGAEELAARQYLLLVEEGEALGVADLLEEEEGLIDQRPGLVVALWIGEEQAGLGLVLMFELGEDGQCLVLVMGHELVADLYEGVRRPCHSGEDHDLYFVRSRDEVSYMGYALGGGHRGTSELHYFHQRCLYEGD